MTDLKRILLLITIFLSAYGFSQDDQSEVNRNIATVSGNFCVILDNSKPVQAYYVADASDLNWQNTEQATKLCGFYSNNLVMYEADFANKKLYIHLYLERTNGSKDISWWNAYLNSLCQ
ncbi:MAG: hypothetical protein IT222_11015 [Crocinitomix sp.]|nr:hypothetical protein [Crocinitomix sp.]